MTSEHCQRILDDIMIFRHLSVESTFQCSLHHGSTAQLYKIEYILKHSVLHLKLKKKYFKKPTQTLAYQVIL